MFDCRTAKHCFSSWALREGVCLCLEQTQPHLLLCWGSARGVGGGLKQWPLSSGSAVPAGALNCALMKEMLA